MGGDRKASARAICGCALSMVVAMGTGLGAVEPLVPEDPIAGRALFESKLCVECHRMESRGSGIGPPLGEGRFGGTFLDFGAALWNHVPAMSASFQTAGLEWPHLTPREARDLISFLYFLDYLGRPGEADRGQRLFRAKGCSGCHSVGGGEARAGPDLGGLQHFVSPLYIGQRIWNHGPSMMESMRRRGMALPTFEEGDLADLAAYIRRESGPAPRERLLASPGNPRRGQDLFVAKGCARCHGDDARGGKGGPNLAEFDLHRSAESIVGIMWNHGLAMRDAMQSEGVAWPEFEGTELADLTAFLYFLAFEDTGGDPGRGERVFTDRSCASCHGEAAGEARGTGGAPPLVGKAPSEQELVAVLWNHAPLMKSSILSKGRRWPDLTGNELQDLSLYLQGGR